MKKLSATYDMIRGFKNRPSNEWLALCEFIDNSISSYKKTHHNEIKNCKIVIEFNDQNPNNVFIKITDNAGGMEPLKLEEAMQPFDRSGKGDTGYNQFGVGMKIGIFWFAENGTVYSKTPNDKQEYKLEFFTEGKNNEEVVVEALQSYDNEVKYESGTTIIVSKVYNERNPITKRDCLNKIEDAIGWRYKNLINEGLFIRIIVNSADKNKNKDCVVQGFNLDVFNYRDLFLTKDNSVTKKQKEEEYSKRLVAIYDGIVSGKYTSELTIEAYNKINNYEDLIFNREIVVNNKPVNLTFGIISTLTKKPTKYSGVSIFHEDRAIIHGPNDNGTGFGNYQFVNVNIGSGGSKNQFRYLFGEVNLTGIECPDENKSKINWSTNGESDLKKALEQIFDDLKPILDLITKVVDIESNVIPNDKEMKKINEQASTKLEPFKQFSVEKYNENERCLTGTCKLFGKECKVRIVETQDNDVNFLKVELDEDILVIKIESENKFWKPLITKDEFKGEFLYPIALLLGVTQYFYNNNIVLDDIDACRSKSYVEILQMLVKDWTL